MITKLIFYKQFCSSPCASTMTGRQLFKHLLRECDKLPKDAKQFYRFSIKQSFKQHVSESDPERVKEIMVRALEDSKWVLKKYASQPQVT